MTQSGLTPAEFEARRWAYADYVSRFGWDAGTEKIKRPIVEWFQVEMVECIETGERYASGRDAGRQCGITGQTVSWSISTGRQVLSAKGGPKSFRRVTVTERVVTNRRSA